MCLEHPRAVHLGDFSSCRACGQYGLRTHAVCIQLSKGTRSQGVDVPDLGCFEVLSSRIVRKFPIVREDASPSFAASDRRSHGCAGIGRAVARAAKAIDSFQTATSTGGASCACALCLDIRSHMPGGWPIVRRCICSGRARGGSTVHSLCTVVGCY